MKSNGNKYCFMDIEVGNKLLDRVVIELFNAQCPKTCTNFLSICTGYKNSDNEHLTYEGSIINRIVKSGFIQGGNLSKLSKFIF
jgi:cyclophilin family peptidyl-prolyl cis-trans isomerase